MRAAAAIAFLAFAAAGAAGDPRAWVEIAATVSQSRPGQGETRVLGTPSETCPVGQECKLFVGRQSQDGAVDADAIRIEVTPTLLDDGRIQLRVVSLGTELGERPADGVRRTGPAQAASRLTFHSALPAEGLYSVAGADGARSWLRIGQTVDGWRLAGYEAAARLLVLSRDGRELRLPMASASVGSATEADGRRTEVVTIPPGGQAQLLGKDGRQVVLSARRVDPAQPR